MHVTVVVACAGKQSRWTRPTPKHLEVMHDGVPLLARTCAQFRRHLSACGATTTTTALVRAGDGDAYRAAVEDLHYVDVQAVEIDESDVPPACDTVLASFDVDCFPDRLLVLYGDTYFTEAAARGVALMATAPGGEDWAVVGRKWGSDLTGKRYGEIFGLFVRGKDAARRLRAGIDGARELYNAGRIHRLLTWEVYRHVLGIPKNAFAGHFHHIDDFTDDFDFVRDLEQWNSKRLAWVADSAARLKRLPAEKRDSGAVVVDGTWCTESWRARKPQQDFDALVGAAAVWVEDGVCAEKAADVLFELSPRAEVRRATVG